MATTEPPEPVATPQQVEISLKIDGAAVERILRTTNEGASLIITLGGAEVHLIMRPNGLITSTVVQKGRLTAAQTFYETPLDSV